MTESEHREEQKPGVGWALERMEEVRHGLGTIFPPEFKEHARAARREFWLAVRSLVDARLEAIEREARPKPEQGPATRGRINVE